MAILMSNIERDYFVGAIQDHFDTFSQYHQLVVVKEPLKQIIDTTFQEYNGYGGYQSAPENYTLTPVSGVFNVMTYLPGSEWEDDSFDPVPISLQKGGVAVKVDENTKNYISEGKNELVILDNETYNIIGGPMPTSYLTQLYWYYNLERTT